MKTHKIESFYFSATGNETPQSWKIGKARVRKYDLRMVFQRDDWRGFVEFLWQSYTIMRLYTRDELTGSKQALYIAAKDFLTELQIGEDYSRFCLLREGLSGHRKEKI